MSGKLELAILVGAESKAWLENLTRQLDRAERVLGGKGNGTSPEAPAETEEEELVSTPKRRGRPKKVEAAAFEETEEVEEAEEAEEAEEVEETEAPASASFDDEEDEPAPKKAKPKKKITIDDVNDAARKHAQTHTRPATLRVLKENFGCESISKIPEEKWGKALEALCVEM